MGSLCRTVCILEAYEKNAYKKDEKEAERIINTRKKKNS